MLERITSDLSKSLISNYRNYTRDQFVEMSLEELTYLISDYTMAINYELFKTVDGTNKTAQKRVRLLMLKLGKEIRHAYREKTLGSYVKPKSDQEEEREVVQD